MLHFLTYFFFQHRAEYKAYRDVKPTKMIRAKSQYLPPVGKTSRETSYSATYNSHAPLQPADNKAPERRRMRSWYCEPYVEPIKQVRPTALTSNHQSQTKFWCCSHVFMLILSLVFASASCTSCSLAQVSSLHRPCQHPVALTKVFQQGSLQHMSCNLSTSGFLK